MLDLCAGFVYSQVLFACVQLRLFELLKDGPLTISDLAAKTALSEDAARRLLTAADAAWLAGDAARAERLLDEALVSTNQDDLRGRVLHLRGHTEYAAGHVRRAADLLAAAAALLERDAPDAAADSKPSPQPMTRASDGSLGIGSLKGSPSHE